jgi:protein transport protein SEC31
LELFDLGITTQHSKPTVIGSVKTTSRFSSIGWTPGSSLLNEHYSMGLIAGGMDNGCIHIWNPMDIISSTNSTSSSNGEDQGARPVNGNGNGVTASLLSTIDRQDNGAISALQFNPHPSSANLLATGSSNGEILISSLDTPDQPTVTIQSDANQAQITNLAWNTEVSHIIASSAANGLVTIWDLRENKPWCELRAETSGLPVSSIKWNPMNGMHLMTASGDDRNPVLKLWDLRASMSMPLASMEGHQRGILGMDWCPHDESLLISCGKDNRTILWDVHTLQQIADLPNVEEGQRGGQGGTGDGKGVSSQELYGSSMQSGLSSNQQRRYDVQWSPIRRGVISSCSFDRKVQAHSVLGIATKSGRPPKWMKPASGVSCGLGGKIVSFGTVDKTVAVMEFVEEPELKAAVEGFEAAVANGDYAGFAAQKARECADYGDGCQAQLWGFMETMFVSNMREALFQYIGFDKDEIAEKAKVFEEEVDISNLSLAESKATPPMTKIAEETVKKALLVGNFDAAVECCIRAGSLADALVLASCGGAELWAKTQAQYFASEVGKRPFLSIVSAVIHNNLAEYVTSSDPASWYETLAFICTYSSEQDFSVLCEALGDHLEGAGDMASASVCFQCAMNLERAARFWLHQLENLEKSAGGEDYLALHDFVVKVAVFMQAGAQSSGLSEDVADALFRYAKIVADQGLYPSAAKYCKSDSQECKELKDRLYRSKDSQMCLQLLGSAPDFPYQYVNVGVAPAASSNNQQTRVAAADTIKPVAQQQSYARSQNQYQAKQTPKASNGYGSANQGYTRNVQQQPEQTQPQYSQQAVQQSTNQYAAQQAVQQSTVQYPSQQAVQQSTNQYAAQQAVQQVQTPAPAQVRVSTFQIYGDVIRCLLFLSDKNLFKFCSRTNLNFLRDGWLSKTHQVAEPTMPISRMGRQPGINPPPWRRGGPLRVLPPSMETVLLHLHHTLNLQHSTEM